MKWPATRISSSAPKSFGMYQRATTLYPNDPDVIHLEVGRPDYDTPLHIKEATKAALDAGKVHYGEFQGELDLRLAIVAQVGKANAIDVGPEQVLVTDGLTHGAYASIMASIDPGDEVILLEPYYPQIINKVQLAGGSVVTVPLDRANDFRIDVAAVEAAITPRTRMIYIVNPNNPTGRVYTRDELLALAALVVRHDLILLSDEVYERIVYDGAKHISIASLPGMAERTISLFAFTKAYAMDGWRLGYLVAPKNFMPALMKITMNDVSHVNVFIQAGGVAALTGDQRIVDEMVEEDRRRRDLICERLHGLAGIVCPPPQSTIYAFADIRATGLTSQQLADDLLLKTKVVVEAGAFYGAAGEGFVRLCFGGEPYHRIEEAMSRIDAYFER